MSLGLGSLANDPELQKFVAAKELENQLTAQVILSQAMFYSLIDF